MICEIKDCGNKATKGNLCIAHYGRKIRGSSMGKPLRVPAGSRIEWLMRHIEFSGPDCLTWPFSTSGNGYAQVTVNGSLIGAHRYMCIQAHGNPPSRSHVAAHSCLNGRNACVNPRHLSWKTYKGNQEDRFRDGTDGRGGKCKTSKISEAEAIEIKRMIKDGKGNGEIASRFGVSNSAISKIRNGNNWAWL